MCLNIEKAWNNANKMRQCDWSKGQNKILGIKCSLQNREKYVFLLIASNEVRNTY